MSAPAPIGQNNAQPIALDALHITKSEKKAMLRPLIKPMLKHFFVAKLNGFTGGKISCLRQKEEETAKTLLQTINKSVSPILNKRLEIIGNALGGVIDDAYVGIKDWGKRKFETKLPKAAAELIINKGSEWLGIDHSEKICKDFLSLVFEVIKQDPDQSVNRLLTIVGVLYTGDIKSVEEGGTVSQTEIKKFIDNFKAECLNAFFFTHKGPNGEDKDSTLSIILTKELGKKLKRGKLKRVIPHLVRFIEKFLIALNAKNFADNFLTKHILTQKRFRAAPQREDVYEKLILKGVSIFVDNKKGDKLKLNDFLNDPFLSLTIREKLNELNNNYNQSKLSQLSTKAEKKFLPALLKRLNEQGSILNMPKKTLISCLIEAAKEAGEELFEGEVTRAVKNVKENITELGKKLVDLGGQIGRALSDLNRRGVDYLKEGFTSFWNWVRGNTQAEVEHKEELNEALEKIEQTRNELKARGLTEEEIDAFIESIVGEQMPTSEEAPKAVAEQRSVAQSEEESTGLLAWAMGKLKAGYNAAKAVFVGSSEPQKEAAINNSDEVKKSDVSTKSEEASKTPSTQRKVEQKSEESTGFLAWLWGGIKAAIGGSPETQKVEKDSDASKVPEAENLPQDVVPAIAVESKEVNAAKPQEKPELTQDVSEEPKVAQEASMPAASSVVPPTEEKITSSANPANEGVVPAAEGIRDTKEEGKVPQDKTEKSEVVVPPDYLADGAEEGDILGTLWEGAKAVGNGVMNLVGWVVGGSSDTPNAVSEAKQTETKAPEVETEKKGEESHWYNPFSWWR